MKKTKVFLLHNIVAPYRNDLFEALNRKVDLFVYFCEEKTKDRIWDTSLQGYSFKRKIGCSFQVGPFLINWDLLKELTSKKYEIFISGIGVRTLFSSITVFVYAKIYRRPFIFWVEFIETPYFKTYKPFKKILNDIFNKFFAFFSSTCVVFSKATRDYLVKLGIPQEKIFYSPQVVKPSPYRNKVWTKQGTVFENKIVILYLGYFLKSKGIDLLIKAFKNLNLSNTILIIGGTGPEEKYLKKLSEGCNNIFFPGYLEGEKKAKYFSIADIFVLPTLHDAWGLVVNEAMEFGLPVITTDGAGCREIVKDNGFIIKTGNIDALANALNLLIRNESLRKKMGELSKKYISKYNIEYCVGKIIDSIKYSLNNEDLIC